MSITKIWLYICLACFTFIGTIEQSDMFFNHLVPEWTHGYVMIPSTVGVPVALQYMFLIISVIVFVDGLDIWMRNNYSPFVMGAGLPHPHSYSGTIKDLAGFIIVRGGGAKFPFPHEGQDAIINLSTHAHQVGDDIIIEGEVIPNRPLDETPAEIKSYIRSTRAGIYGAKQISMGWLSPVELHKHKNNLIKHNDTNYSITDFIELFTEHLINYDANLQLRDFEPDKVEQRLAFTDKIGKTSLPTKKENSIKSFFLK